MNRSLFALHRWLGLLAGVFLLLIGLSGSILIYHDSMDRWLNPALYHIEPYGSRLSLDSMYGIVYQKYSENFSSLSLDIPANAEEVYEFTLTEPQENYHTRRRYIVDIHPYSGTILREGYCDEISTSFIHWVMYFHNSFHYGRIGMLIVSLVSVTIFLSMITGLLVYGKNILNVLMFRIPLRQKSGTRLYRSIHLYVAVWALLFNVIVFFTGFWMMKATFTPDAWKLDEQRQKTRLSVSLDSCLAKSRELLLGFIPDYIAIPLMQGDFIEIDGNMTHTTRLMYGDASRVVFDPQSGEVMEATDITQAPFPENLVAVVWPLHIGNYGGDGIKILYVIGGLMPGILSISGFMLWWKRKRLYAAFRR
ncbi:MAG: PepSY domain-containing protein [Ignavibacteriae bacterium]|nr:PepSY domain-containing protein [Ignavibacteriota bacterium]